MQSVLGFCAVLFNFVAVHRTRSMANRERTEIPAANTDRPSKCTDPTDAIVFSHSPRCLSLFNFSKRRSRSRGRHGSRSKSRDRKRSRDRGDRDRKRSKSRERKRSRDRRRSRSRGGGGRRSRDRSRDRRCAKLHNVPAFLSRNILLFFFPITPVYNESDVEN